MHLCKFFKIMGIATIVALSYIHMQMQIIYLAYQGNQREQQIRSLVEENGNSMYNILMLKSANHLGAAMFDEGSDMQFADAGAIIQITASEEFFMDNYLGTEPKHTQRANPLLSLLSFGAEAEATTAE